MNPQRHSRVKAIFLQALELDPAERDEFLNRECADDPELRSEVASLLEHHNPQTILPQPRNDNLEQTPATRAGRGTVRAIGFTAWGLVGRLASRPIWRNATIVLVVVMLAVVGMWMYHGMKSSLDALLADHLQAVRDADVAALQLWSEEKKADARMCARRPHVRQSVAELVRIRQANPSPRDEVLKSPALANLRDELREFTGNNGSTGFAVIDDGYQVLAAELDEHVGIRLKSNGIAAVAPVLAGTTKITKPHPEGSFAADQEIRFDAPVVWVNAPIRNDQQQIIATLGFGHPADEEFTRILSVARMGETGETYAFDATGNLLSESRFNDQLREIGMIPNEPDSRSIFAVQIRDPGGDLTAGFRPVQPRAEQPLTKLVRRAIASRLTNDPSQQKGVILQPYRDYRGVEVIGAWQWLPDYDIGIATEVDRSEAYAPLSYPITAFWIRFGVLAVAVSLLLLAAFRIVLLKRQVGAIQQLGKYTLLEKIGEGGIGQVYLARHAMLRRPTAVKLLKQEQTSAASIRRFEREVQLASQLTHPNTIEIYDFGRTSEGVFFYAMEYLPGISLAELIALAGPIPAARVVHILKQICASLKEAHGVGLIHRDIKPQNVMLCERGGEVDFVKVLDFGLVKDMTSVDMTRIQSPLAMFAGTPMYMAPERLRAPDNVDARSDLYAVGAVGYNLLTGQDLFECAGTMELLQHVCDTVPARPSTLVDSEIPAQLDQLIVDCLAKSPDERPKSAEAMLDVLNALSNASHWTPEDAEHWWKENEGRIGATMAVAAVQTRVSEAAQTTSDALGRFDPPSATT